MLNFSLDKREMVIAIATHCGNDFREFVYFKIERGEVKERETARTPDGLELLKRQLLGLEIDLLIADSVPQTVTDTLDDAGVCLISGISGDPDRVLSQYLKGELEF